MNIQEIKEMYVDKRMSAKQIATYYNVAEKLIKYKIRYAKISKEPRFKGIDKSLITLDNPIFCYFLGL